MLNWCRASQILCGLLLTNQSVPAASSLTDQIYTKRDHWHTWHTDHTTPDLLHQSNYTAPTTPIGDTGDIQRRSSTHHLHHRVNQYACQLSVEWVADYMNGLVNPRYGCWPISHHFYHPPNTAIIMPTTGLNPASPSTSTMRRARRSTNPSFVTHQQQKRRPLPPTPAQPNQG